MTAREHYLYNAVLYYYGALLTPECFIVTPSGKVTHVKLTVKNDRLIITGENEQKLFSGKNNPTTLVEFVRRFWFWEPKNKPILNKDIMHNPTGRSIHTADFDRCVRDVKRKGGSYNPYAVCMSTLGEKRAVKAAHRRKNPSKKFIIKIIQGNKFIGYLTPEEQLDTDIHDAKVFSNLSDAKYIAEFIKVKKLVPGVYARVQQVHTYGDNRENKRKNPVNGFLLTVKNTATGQRAYYTGEEPEAFDSNRQRGKIYASAAHAQAAARMLARDKNLKPGWRYAVAVASRSNPEIGEKLYTDFHGEAPRRIKHHDLRQFSRGLEIGPVFAITYDTLRDGKNIRFEHEFSKRAAPLLIASNDGRTLALTGGRYQFTDRGIVDRK